MAAGHEAVDQGFVLKPAADIPPRLLYLIGRLAEMEQADLPQMELAPSIVPSIEEMSTTDVTADAA